MSVKINELKSFNVKEVSKVLNANLLRDGGNYLVSIGSKFLTARYDKHEKAFFDGEESHDFSRVSECYLLPNVDRPSVTNFQGGDVKRVIEVTEIAKIIDTSSIKDDHLCLISIDNRMGLFTARYDKQSDSFYTSELYIKTDIIECYLLPNNLNGQVIISQSS